MAATFKETSPLQWPSGQPRTRIPDQREKRVWKKTHKQYVASLVEELERSGASSVVVTFNAAVEGKGPRDAGVAVYFTRKGAPDYSWMDVLGVTDPSATLEDIEAARIAKAKLLHPDNKQTGDPELFVAMHRAYERAKLWVEGKSENDQQFVIACDRYKEVRWNIQAVRVVVASLRRIDDAGASGMLDRAFKGFAALPANTGGGQ